MVKWEHFWGYKLNGSEVYSVITHIQQLKKLYDCDSFRVVFCTCIETHSDNAAERHPCSPPVWNGSRRTGCWSDCGSPVLQPAACDWPGPAVRLARLRLWLTAARSRRDSRSSPKTQERCAHVYAWAQCSSGYCTKNYNNKLNVWKLDQWISEFYY